MKRLDGDADGLLTCDEFVAGFAAGDPSADTSAAAAVIPGKDQLVIPLQRIPELYSNGANGAQGAAGGTLSGGGVRGPIVSFGASELGAFVAALRPCPSTQPVRRHQLQLE